MSGEPTTHTTDVTVVGAGDAAAVATIELLAADGERAAVVISDRTGTRPDWPPAALAADRRVSSLDGEVIGIDRTGGRFRLAVRTPDGDVTVDTAALGVACGDARLPVWQAWLHRLGALGRPGGIEVDMHGQSSVDRLFMIESDDPRAPGRRLAAGTGRQSGQDRMIYDLIWSRDRDRRPDPEVVDLVDRATDASGDRRPVFVDLGCGVGRNALFAAAKGMRVIAIDHSARAIDKLRATAHDLDLAVDAIEGDFVAWLDGTDVTADVIACVSSVHHVSPDSAEVTRVLRRAAGLLVPGGRCFVALLTEIRYGELPPPPGRLMVSAADGEALLRAAFAGLDLAGLRREFNRQDDVVLMDNAKGEFVRSFHECVKISARFRRPTPEVAR